MSAPRDKMAVIAAILKKDSRYQRDAYLFVEQAVKYTSAKFQEQRKNRSGHVSPKELLYGTRDYALECFGPLAFDLLQEWGVATTGDLGAIVFLMIDHGLLAANESDTLEQFNNVYDFHSEFVKPYLPSGSHLDIPQLD